MQSKTQRSQWAQHLRDEAHAHQAQQASAGTTHEPVSGPLPYSADDLEKAVRGERERCAAIADQWASKEELLGAFSELTEWELRAAQETAQAIARVIRREAGR